MSRREEAPRATVGRNLRRIRKSKRVSQPELSKLSGVSQAGISAIEIGKREAYPSTLERLAGALGVSIADFFEEGDSPTSEEIWADLDRLHDLHEAGKIDTDTFLQRSADALVAYTPRANAEAQARAAEAAEAERISKEAS